MSLFCSSLFCKIQSILYLYVLILRTSIITHNGNTMIDRATVDKIYATANVVEVVSDFISLRKQGVNYTACCPFHNEKTPSFVVSPSKGLYKCFGCGKGGNAVTFVMEHEKLTYVEALKWVAKKYGIPVEEREETPEEKQRNDDRESMMIVNAWASDYFMKALYDTDEGLSVARSYFAGRGLTDATIRKFGLGYCPGRGDVMTQAALKGGYKEKFLIDTGLTIKRETGGYYDRFCGRAMFPIQTISGRVTAFSGRALSGENKAKYVNSPESIVYSKSNNLYGIYFAKSAIAKEDHCILVEGNIDVVQMHQKGIENVVAPLGTALTAEQVRVISRFTRNITLLFDGDNAGVKAAIKGVDLVLKEGMNVRVVVLPEGEDPDSYARAHTADQIREFIDRNRKDFISFKASLYAEQVQRDPIRKAELISDMVSSIALIPDDIQRSVFIKECAKTMDVDESLLTGEVIRKRMGTQYDRHTHEFIRNQQARQRVEERELKEMVSVGRHKAGSSMTELEKELAGYLIKYGHCSFNYRDGKVVTPFNVADTIFAEIEGEGLQFRDARYRAIMGCYQANRGSVAEGEKVPEHFFIEMNDPEASSAAVDILTENDNYKQSQIWKEHDIYIDTEEERLGKIIPKSILLYKSKAIEALIEELNKQLADMDEEAAEYMSVVEKIVRFNSMRKEMAEKIQRNIL